MTLVVTCLRDKRIVARSEICDLSARTPRYFSFFVNALPAVFFNDSSMHRKCDAPSTDRQGAMRSLR